MRAVALTPPSPPSRPSPLGARAGSTARAPAPPGQALTAPPRHGLGKPSLGLVNQKKHLETWFVTQNSLSLPSVRVLTQTNTLY